MQRYNVLLLKLPQHFDLSHGGLLHDFIVIGLFELLDRNCKESGVRKCVVKELRWYIPTSPVSLLRAMKTFP